MAWRLFGGTGSVEGSGVQILTFASWHRKLWPENNRKLHDLGGLLGLHGFTVVELLRNTVKQRHGKVMFTVSGYHHNWIFRMLLEKGVAPPTGLSMHLGVVRMWIAHSLNAHPTQELIFALFFLIPGPRECFEKLQPLHPIILLEEELFHQSSLQCDEWEVTGWKRHHGHYHEEATECAGLMKTRSRTGSD